MLVSLVCSVISSASITAMRGLAMGGAGGAVSVVLLAVPGLALGAVLLAGAAVALPVLLLTAAWVCAASLICSRAVVRALATLGSPSAKLAWSSSRLSACRVKAGRCSSGVLARRCKKVARYVFLASRASTSVMVSPGCSSRG